MTTEEFAAAFPFGKARPSPWKPGYARAHVEASAGDRWPGPRTGDEVAPNEDAEYQAAQLNREGA